MNDKERSIDQEGLVPVDGYGMRDSEDVPDMTPEQKERIDRKVRTAITAQNRRFAWERRGKWALSAGLVAACCGGGIVFALHTIAPPELAEDRAASATLVGASRSEPVGRTLGAAPRTSPPPSVSASGEPADAGMAAPPRRPRRRP